MSHYEEPDYGNSELPQSIELEAPGAGLPKLESRLLNFGLKTYSSFMSDTAALKLFKKESVILRGLANNESIDESQAVLIPPMMGIEDSSRNWSVLMVLNHLVQTNKDMLKAIQALCSGVVPSGTVEIASYKPSDETGFDIVEIYREETIAYEIAIEDLLERNRSLKTKLRYRHPWFGPLNAHQWHCLSGLHQRIHRKQAQKISAMLGIA